MPQHLHAGIREAQSKAAEAKPDAKKKSSEVEPAKEWVKPTFADIKEAFPMLCGALLRALNKTRHSIRINPMQCSITFGGDDPVAITQAYGWANTVVWTAMPQLERVIDIPAPYIHLEPDFQSPATHFEGKLGISFRVGDLIRIGLAAGIPALRWYLALQKKTKPATTAQTA